MDELRMFFCNNRHVLGVISTNSGGLHSLLLYRHAIDYKPDQGTPVNVDVMAILESAEKIKCDVCESIRDWVPGDKELDSMYKRRMRHQRQREKLKWMVTDLAVLRTKRVVMARNFRGGLRHRVARELNNCSIIKVEENVTV